MGTSDSAQVMDSIRKVFGGTNLSQYSDTELLARYLNGDEDTAETAFEVLVARHGPMVLRICRKILGDGHDAEDATQATFLVLARHASSIRKSRSLASWLFGVASRVSARAKIQASRRRRLEFRAARPSIVEPQYSDSGSWQAIMEELERLPERYRASLILFHINGLSYEEAAERLGCPIRTLQSRLIRGRERLRARLTRRGLADAAGLVGTTLNGKAASTLASAEWATRMTRSVIQLSSNLSLHPALPASLAALAKGMSATMGYPRFKILAALLVTATAVIGSAPAWSLLEDSNRGESRPIPSKGSRVPPLGSSPVLAQTQPKTVEKSGPKKAEAVLLKKDEGKSSGMRSIAGSGHAVRFEAPGGSWQLTSVSLYGSRYGTSRPPKENFEIYLCDENFKKLATFSFPYSTFQRGEPKWIDLNVKPTTVPAKFFVAVDFDPAQTKGVYMHFDGRKSETSFTGLPDEGDPEAFTKGNWMIRARVSPQPEP
ncbi:RNA polymerase sigma factor [Singulisphaera sp. PoT]|uniref:RNA polymerase sigma factor n=1 Tax=Singulisphaera sp. PoT TaxID=3411797 RepID=UPI003BF46F16